MGAGDFFMDQSRPLLGMNTLDGALPPAQRTLWGTAPGGTLDKQHTHRTSAYKPRRQPPGTSSMPPNASTHAPVTPGAASDRVASPGEDPTACARSGRLSPNEAPAPCELRLPLPTDDPCVRELAQAKPPLDSWLLSAAKDCQGTGHDTGSARFGGHERSSQTCPLNLAFDTEQSQEHGLDAIPTFASDLRCLVRNAPNAKPRSMTDSDAESAALSTWPGWAGDAALHSAQKRSGSLRNGPFGVELGSGLNAAFGTPEVQSALEGGREPSPQGLSELRRREEASPFSSVHGQARVTAAGAGGGALWLHAPFNKAADSLDVALRRCSDTDILRDSSTGSDLSSLAASADARAAVDSILAPPSPPAPPQPPQDALAPTPPASIQPLTHIYSLENSIASSCREAIVSIEARTSARPTRATAGSGSPPRPASPSAMAALSQLHSDSEGSLSEGHSGGVANMQHMRAIVGQVLADRQQPSLQPPRHCPHGRRPSVTSPTSTVDRALQILETPQSRRNSALLITFEDDDAGAEPAEAPAAERSNLALRKLQGAARRADDAGGGVTQKPLSLLHNSPLSGRLHRLALGREHVSGGGSFQKLLERSPREGARPPPMARLRQRSLGCRSDGAMGMGARRDDPLHFSQMLEDLYDSQEDSQPQLGDPWPAADAGHSTTTFDAHFADAQLPGDRPTADPVSSPRVGPDALTHPRLHTPHGPSSPRADAVALNDAAQKLPGPSPLRGDRAALWPMADPVGAPPSGAAAGAAGGLINVEEWLWGPLGGILEDSDARGGGNPDDAASRSTVRAPPHPSSRVSSGASLHLSSLSSAAGLSRRGRRTSGSRRSMADSDSSSAKAASMMQHAERVNTSVINALRGRLAGLASVPRLGKLGRRRSADNA